MMSYRSDSPEPLPQALPQPISRPDVGGSRSTQYGRSPRLQDYLQANTDEVSSQGKGINIHCWELDLCLCLQTCWDVQFVFIFVLFSLCF